MNKMSIRLAGAILSCIWMGLASSGSALAQASAASPSASAAKLNASDTAFLKQAAEAGLAEVEAGTLAADKGVNTQVKGFAHQMVDDHTKMHADLRTLAGSKGVRLPIEPSLGQRTRIRLLSASDGGSFDRKYADAIAVKLHEDALKLFQKATTGASDADVKAFAAKTLPALQQHLQTARELKSVVDKEGNVKARGNVKQ